MNGTDDFRAKLGTRLVFWSTIALVALGIVIMGASIVAALNGKPDSVMNAAQLLLSALLPLFGTWVGTILAFYYSKENYEAASQSTLDVVKSVAQRLRSTPVAAKMMPLAQIVFAQLPADGSIGSLKLSDLEAKFDTVGANGQKISRLLILNNGGACVGILHHSVLAEMLAIGLRDTPPIDLTTATLSSLLTKECRAYKGMTYGDFLQKTIAFAGQDRTMADAKAAMEQIPGCQDVIVNKTGDKAEPMIGWLSNIDISRLSAA
jgi:hypothetical protein